MGRVPRAVGVAEPAEAGRRQSAKNGADIRIAVEVMTALRAETRYDEFVLASSDADFTPLLQVLRAHDRRVTVISTGSSTAAYEGPRRPAAGRAGRHRADPAGRSAARPVPGGAHPRRPAAQRRGRPLGGVGVRHVRLDRQGGVCRRRRTRQSLRPLAAAEDGMSRPRATRRCLCPCWCPFTRPPSSRR